MTTFYKFTVTAHCKIFRGDSEESKLNSGRKHLTVDRNVSFYSIQFWQSRTTADRTAMAMIVVNNKKRISQSKQSVCQCMSLQIDF